MIRDPALVVVDMQKDFCREYDEESDTFVEDERIQPTVEATANLLARYRESGRDPIFVRAEHSEATVSEEWARRYDRPREMSCVVGSEGAEFVPELGVREDDHVVTKHRYDGFHKTDLDQYLSTNNISRILFAGVGTNVCVLSTLLGAYNRDYAVTMLSDCCGSVETDLHEATLKNVESHFGTVEESTEIDLS